MELQEILSHELPGKVLIPETEEYGKSNSEYFTLFESDIRPAFIVQPTSVQEVSRLLTALQPLLARREIHLAIRGTGHTPFAGSANIENGITVDMRGLKGVSLSEDKSVVDIGVGETWGSVYAELEKYELTTAGGRVGRVGVGGLVLGGGLSFYSTQRGFAADSVIDFEIVLASGQVARANDQENPDLWVALKGGLNNFGVVTSFKMKTFQSENIWGGIAYYGPTTFNKLIQATVDFVSNETDEDTHIMASAGYAFGNHVVTCCMYQTKGVENPPSLQRFTSLPDQFEQYQSLRTSTHIDFCNELSKFTSDGVRSFYATITIRPDVHLMNEIHQAWLQTLEPLKASEGLIFSLGFFPLTKALLQNSQLAGGNAKDIDPADGPLLVVLINPTWNLAQDDERVYKGVEDLLAKAKQLSSRGGLLHRYIFANYAYYKEDLFNGYSERGLSWLRQASNKYDPAGIFQKAVPGGFKLSR